MTSTLITVWRHRHRCWHSSSYRSSVRHSRKIPVTYPMHWTVQAVVAFREPRTAGYAFLGVLKHQSDVRWVAQSLDMHPKLVEYVAPERTLFRHVANMWVHQTCVGGQYCLDCIQHCFHWGKPGATVCVDCNHSTVQSQMFAPLC